MRADLKKRDWNVGTVLSLSGGIVMIIAAFLPWGSTLTPQRTFTAIELRFFTPFVIALLSGLALSVVSYLRTPWTALTAMMGALVAGLIMLMIHGDLFDRLTAAGANLGSDVGHPYGFGVAVFLSAGVLLFAAAVAVSIEDAPPIGTPPPTA